MANEAFALSPISARAASPNDADFEAIREAFLETARGRWFLEEYTKRNRNADTAMVLEAVARIERTLAARKDEPTPQPSDELPGAIKAVKEIVATARDNAMAALSGPVLEEALAPSRKCARIIREIAWGLRESGADGRICSLLDMQVDAINAACDQVAAGGLRDGVLQAFDQAAEQIKNLTAASAASPPVEPGADTSPVVLTLVPAPSEAIREDATGDSAEIETASAASVAELAPEPIAMAEAVTFAEPAEALTELQSTVEPIEPQTARAVHLTIVPETIDDEPVAPVSPEPAAVMPAPIEAESLGATLIASGVVARPATARADLLAPFRRMSQAERVAFFS